MSERKRIVWPPPRRGIRDCASWVGVAARIGVHAPRLEDAVEDAILVIAMLESEYEALLVAAGEWETCGRSPSSTPRKFSGAFMRPRPPSTT